MIAEVSLGTLGLSGKYLNISSVEARKIIESIHNIDFKLIDAATVYANNGNSIDIFIAESYSYEDKSVFYKIGADNLDGNVDELISEFKAAKKIYGEMLKCIILHRVDPKLIKNHSIFFQFMRQNFPEILLGISTYSENVLEAYHFLNIDIVQAPLNLIDYFANEKIFRSAKKNGIVTQARSCLASGLLSGRYLENDLMNFNDSIRGRYKISLGQMSIYKKRIKAVDGVRKFHKYACDKYDLKISMSNFSYSVIANLEVVDHIIVGGTTVWQIEDNILLNKLPNELMAEILEDNIYAWQAESL